MTAPYIAVVGAVNIDIKGQPFASPIMEDSNPGRVTRSLGGVGCNIAQNLRLFGADVVFLTAFGDDAAGEGIRNDLGSLGIDIRHALHLKDVPTSTYLFINDETGNMKLAVSDMKIVDHITPEYLEAHISLLNSAAVVVAETNLPEESIRFLAESCTAPLYIDPVSVTKAKKLKPYLSGIHTLKPNRAEAELLTDTRITDEASLRHAAMLLVRAGVKQVYLSLGEEGVLYADEKNLKHYDIHKARTVNTTGAGDAFIAALAYARVLGLSPEETASAALLAAAVTTESEGTVNPACRDVFR